MKIAFLHYHLKPGGVTTVINQQVNAVKNDCEILLITSAPPKVGCPFKTVIIPEIGYDVPHKKWPEPEHTAQKIIRAITDQWPGGCDILHVHNPLLCKNRFFLKILATLSDKNIRLLLQIHDFAEDGRPGSFYADDDYPADCHYSVINSRDDEILLASGLKRAGLHRLLNMVTPFNIQPEEKTAKPIVLYPVRAIRRKNIGEAILLSLFFKENETLAITLPPHSIQDWHYYRNWKQFAADSHANVLFEASAALGFSDLVSSSKTMITTSISEGFGFSFLEPWTAGRMLTGRRLPQICADFSEKGMKLDHLYDKILIPIDSFSFHEFYQKWKSCFCQNALKFKVPISDAGVEEAYKSLIAGQYIDFGFLDEHFQQQVLAKIVSDKKFKKQISSLNPFLSEITGGPDDFKTVMYNRAIVETHFSRSAYRKQLLETYEKVIHTEVTHQIDKQLLAGKFLTPENFSLLKWSGTHV